MIYMVTAWYPCDKIKTLMAAFKKAPKLPNYIKKWQTFGAADGNIGYKGYNLIFVEEKASDEAAIFIAKMQQHFVENVQGYMWKIEVLMSVKDALKVLS